MKKNLKTCLSILTAAFLLTGLTACEKAIMEEEEVIENSKQQVSNNKTAKGNQTIHVSDFHFVPYTQQLSAENTGATRAVIDLTTYCTRLNYVVYKDGKKVDSRSQLKEDGGFGEVTMTLSPGTYKLLVLAHSSRGGNPTLSDPEHIQFTNALGYSDTFSYYDNIEVTSESKTHEVILTRNSSLLNFIVEDEIPENVAKIHFFYTGGSGVLNAITGYGANVNSKQERLYNITGLTAPLSLPIYTFLQEDEGKLEVMVTAQDANGNTVKTRKFSDIPMKRNSITEYKGTFFDHDSNNNFAIKGDIEWSDTLHLNY